MSRIIIRKITSITSIITPRDSRSQVWSASSTVPVAIDTLAYKTLDGNGSFEKRGNNRRNKILDSILLAAGFISKEFSLVGFSLYFRKPSTSALDGNDRSCNCIFTPVHRSIKHSYLQLSLAGESRIPRANHRFQVYRSKPSNIEFFRRWKRPIELT